MWFGLLLFLLPFIWWKYVEPKTNVNSTREDDKEWVLCIGVRNSEYVRCLIGPKDIKYFAPNFMANNAIRYSDINHTHILVDGDLLINKKYTRNTLSQCWPTYSNAINLDKDSFMKLLREKLA